MIAAREFYKAQKAIESARQQTESEMPQAEFIFIGMNEFCIFFNVVAQLSLITTDAHIRNLKEKTRFALISEEIGLIYRAKFFMDI